MSQKYNKTEVFIKKISYQAERLADGLAFFDFYDPGDQKDIQGELRHYPDLSYEFFGGHNNCERKMLCLKTKEKEKKISWPISLCKAEVDFPVDHRMVLGAIMSLGITREIIGDILIDDHLVQVLIKDHMATYICQNLQKLSNRRVQFELANLDKTVVREQKFQIQKVTVSSYRLDALVSAAYGMSREVASELIKKKGLKINHEEKTKPSHTAQIGDLFSVKGKGRFILDEFIGTTKKDKNKVIIKKYM